MDIDCGTKKQIITQWVPGALGDASYLTYGMALGALFTSSTINLQGLTKQICTPHLCIYLPCRCLMVH